MYGKLIHTGDNWGIIISPFFSAKKKISPFLLKARLEYVNKTKPIDLLVKIEKTNIINVIVESRRCDRIECACLDCYSHGMHSRCPKKHHKAFNFSNKPARNWMTAPYLPTRFLSFLHKTCVPSSAGLHKGLPGFTNILPVLLYLINAKAVE